MRLRVLILIRVLRLICRCLVRVLLIGVLRLIILLNVCLVDGCLLDLRVLFMVVLRLRMINRMEMMDGLRICLLLLDRLLVVDVVLRVWMGRLVLNMILRLVCGCVLRFDLVLFVFGLV